MRHPSYSPDIVPCEFWLFGFLKRILKDREFPSSDEIEEAIEQVWNDFPFDDLQSVFRNWMSGLAWVTQNGGEYIHQSNGICLPCLRDAEIGGGAGVS
jgi:histone-lysine N-methyltransferase SETMAR